MTTPSARQLIVDSIQRLLLGPWSHMSTATSLPGPHLDLVPELVRWCRRWLADDPNGVENEQVTGNR